MLRLFSRSVYVWGCINCVHNFDDHSSLHFITLFIFLLISQASFDIIVNYWLIFAHIILISYYVISCVPVYLTYVRTCMHAYRQTDRHTMAISLLKERTSKSAFDFLIEALKPFKLSIILFTQFHKRGLLYLDLGLGNYGEFAHKQTCPHRR